jgi:hypothetical protein
MEMELPTPQTPILEPMSSEQLLEALKELRLKHWGDIMMKDLAEMTPSEQGIILKCSAVGLRPKKRSAARR